MIELTALSSHEQDIINLVRQIARASEGRKAELKRELAAIVEDLD